MKLPIARVFGEDQVHRLTQGRGVVGKDAHLVAQGGVDDDLGPALEGGDIRLFPPAHVVPHGQGLPQVGAAEVEVPHRPAGQAHPGPLKSQRSAVAHVAAGGDIHAGGLGMAARNIVIEGVDALEYGYLILAQTQGRDGGVPHLAGKGKFGDQDLLPPGQGGKMLIQQVHVQQPGRLVIDLARLRPGRGAVVQRFEIVIHGNRVGIDAPALQLLLHLLGRGGLARAGGAGQKHHRTFIDILDDAVGGTGHLQAVLPVALLQKILYVAPDTPVDLLQLIGHGISSFSRQI